MECVKHTSCPEDFHDELLGQVGSHLLVGTDEDVVFTGVPSLAEGIRGSGIDKGRDHPAVVPGMKETKLRAFGRLRNDGLNWLTHGFGQLGGGKVSSCPSCYDDDRHCEA